uniref:Putative secreted protein n=1 Tax=Anopheles darlingi TaxID=43151 RepID=A0A2M4DKW7_ANODA
MLLQFYRVLPLLLPNSSAGPRVSMHPLSLSPTGAVRMKCCCSIFHTLSHTHTRPRANSTRRRKRTFCFLQSRRDTLLLCQFIPPPETG